MKSKILIRLLASVLASIMAVTMLASCSKKEDENTEDDEKELTEGGLNGFTLNVLSKEPWYTDTPEDLMYTEEANGDTMREMVYARNARVQKKYGLEITQTYLDREADIVDEIVKITAAQDDAYQLCMSGLGLVTYYDQNLVYNALDVPYIDYEADYWFPEVMDEISINGYSPALCTLILPGTNEGMVVTMYNTPLAEDFAIDNLYEVVNEGGWTFDRRIEEMAKVVTDLDNNGQYSFNDRIGMLYASNNCTPYLKGAGIKFAYKDADGSFVFDTSVADKAELTIEKASKMLKSKGYAMDWLVAVDGITTIINMIESKNVLFQDIILSIVRRFYREVKTDFGILPLPKLSEDQDYYYNNSISPSIAIPSSNTNLEKTGFALEALSRESTEFPNTYFHVCLESKFTRDEESIDMIMLGYEHPIVDPLFAYGFGGFTEALNAIIPMGRSYATVYANYADAIEEAMESYMDINAN